MDGEKDTEQNVFGLKLGKDARLWRTYLSEALNRDEAKLRIWDESMDVLLIFAGLFSAVLTAFLIDSYKTLQPNANQTTVQLLAVLTTTLQMGVHQGFGNSNVLLPAIPSTDFEIPRWSLWLNMLWFSSLAITLIAALGALTVKQLIRTYWSGSLSGNLEEQALRHRFRRDKLKSWHIPLIVDAVPYLIYIALALFLAGMVVFLFTLNSSLAILIATLGGAATICFVTSVLLPIYDPSCPFRSPTTSIIEIVLLYLSKKFHKTFAPKAPMWNFAARDYPGYHREVKHLRSIREGLLWKVILWLLKSRSEESANVALEHVVYCQTSLREHGFEAHNTLGLMDRLEEKVPPPGDYNENDAGGLEPQLRQMTSYLLPYCTGIRQMAIDKRIEGRQVSPMSGTARAWYAHGAKYGLHYIGSGGLKPQNFLILEPHSVLVICLSTYARLLDDDPVTEAAFDDYPGPLFEYSKKSTRPFYRVWLLDAFSLLVVEHGWPENPDPKIVAGILSTMVLFPKDLNIQKVCSLALGMYGMNPKERKAFYKAYLDCVDLGFFLSKFTASVLPSCRKVISPKMEDRFKDVLLRNAGTVILTNIDHMTLMIRDPDDVDVILPMIRKFEDSDAVRLKFINRLFNQPIKSNLGTRKFVDFSFQIANYLAVHSVFKKEPEGLRLIGKLVKDGFCWYEPPNPPDYKEILNTLFSNLAPDKSQTLRNLSAKAIGSFPLYWHSRRPIAPWNDPERVTALCNFFESGNADKDTKSQWCTILNHLPKHTGQRPGWLTDVGYSLDTNDPAISSGDVAWDENVFRALITALLPHVKGLVDEAIVERLQAYLVDALDNRGGTVTIQVNSSTI